MKGVIRRILAVAGVTALAAGIGITGVANAPTAEAADASQFDPGMLITDSLFHDSDAMTAAQVQTFLNEKGKNCTSNCLKDHKLNTTSQPATARCDGYTGRNNETAAAVIANVAASCGISPKVLLVMLEKETSLVTMAAPQGWRYERAMGYYCPDDPNRPGWCHPDYAGLFNQIYNASAQLKRYEQNPYSYGYVAGKTNNILYHPNASCGTKSVYIQNQATASLYIYTPYTPNQAAMNNLYGTGDSCSAYGNRNFWRLYTDWFGSTKVEAPQTKPATTTKPTPTPTATPKPTATATPKPTVTAAPKPTATATPTATPKPTVTAAPKPTATATPTATPKPTVTAAPKPTATPTPTATPKPTATANPTATATPRPTATAAPTVAPKPTSTAKPTPDGSLGSGAHGEATATAKPVPPKQDAVSDDAKADDEPVASPTTGNAAAVNDETTNVAKGTDASDDAQHGSSNAPLTVIPPSDNSAEGTEPGAEVESTDESTLTVVPTVSAESVAGEDALAQTGAAQLLVMLGAVVSLGVLGTTVLIARRRTT